MRISSSSVGLLSGDHVYVVPGLTSLILMMNPFSPLRRPRLGSTAARIAKGTLLSAGIATATLLAGGEVKAQPTDLIACTIGVDCPEANNIDGWVIGDKRLTWNSLPAIDGVVGGRPDAADRIIFQFEQEAPDEPGRWEVVLEFEPNSQFGGSTNNTFPDRQPRNPDTGNVAEAAWTYTLQVLDPHSYFQSASAGADVSAAPGGFFDVVKDVAWNGSVTRFDLNEGAPNPQVQFIGGRTLTTTLDWGTCPNCSIASISDAYTQITPSKVPGPLPILGAAAAFGTSRRIRSRIKARNGVDTTVA
jgi:hypothetical protein